MAHDLHKEFTNGVIYAIYELDDVPNRAGGVSTTEVYKHGDGELGVTVKTSFDLPRQTRKRMTTALTGLAEVTEVKFEPYPLVKGS